MLQFMGSQRVGHNWVTELNWTESFESTYVSNQLIHFKFAEWFVYFMSIKLEIIIILLSNEKWKIDNDPNSFSRMEHKKSVYKG